MNWVDVIVIGLWTFGLIKGSQRGLVRAMATPLGIFLGLAAGYLFSGLAATFIEDWLPWETARIAISFAAVFIAVLVAVELVGAFVNKALSFLFLPWVDKLGGATGGLVSSSLVVGIASGIISRLAFNYPAPLIAAIEGSKTLEIISRLTPFILRFLPS